MKKTLRFYFILIVSLFFNVSFAQQGISDSTFNTYDDGFLGDGFDGTVRATVLQPDGMMLVGGDFLNFNGTFTPQICRLLPDGSKDPTFNTGLGLNGKVYSILLLASGKIILGGSFTSFNGLPANRLIRLNSDGSLDLTFNTTVAASSGIIYNMVEQSDGRIIIVGSFTKYDGVTANRVARILPTGGLDLSFVTSVGASSLVEEVQLQTDGKIILAGSFVSFNGTPCGRIIRLTTTGIVDNSFAQGLGFDNSVSALAIQSDGKIIVGGSFLTYNVVTAQKIIRLNADGSIDASFLSGTGFANGVVESVRVNASGSIFVGGSFSTTYNAVDVNRIVMLMANGSVISGFDIGAGPASGSIYSFAEDSFGNFYASGSFSVFDSQNQGRLARFDTNGVLDIAYLTAGVGFDNSVLGLIPLADNSALVFGNFSKFNGSLCSKITRLLPSGAIDPLFNVLGSGANNTIKTAVVQTDQKIVFAGAFTSYNGAACGRIIRILADGAVDVSFATGSGFNNQVYDVALQADGKIIIVGNFTSYNGVPINRVVRLLNDGSLDPTLNVGIGADAIVETVVLQSDGKLLLGGQFSNFNGTPQARITRLLPDGSLDSSFVSGLGLDKTVYAIAFQSDGKIVLGGSFSDYNGNASKRIVRLESNGAFDSSFNMGSGFSTGDVRAIVVQLDDRLLIGGTFAGTYNGLSVKRLIRTLSNGQIDPTFSAVLNNTLFAMAITINNKLIIGGNFNSISGITKHRVARLKLCTNSSTWDGISWSNGSPSSEKTLLINANYTIANTINACSCNINSFSQVTVASSAALNLMFDYSGAGTLILENSGVLFQEENHVVNSGQMKMHRKTTPLVKSDYTYWSSPVASHVLADVSPNAPQDRLFSYNSVLNKWVGELPTAVMTVGKGYIIRSPSNFSETVPAVYEAVFTGVPNNGQYNVAIVGASTFNLIGNPYPSTLNADLFLDRNKTIIGGTMYFWTHNTAITNYNYNSGDYAAYNLFGGVGTAALNLGVNTLVPKGKIAAGQSFFVLGINSGGNAIFDNSMRESSGNEDFFKIQDGKDKKVGDTDKHRLWLNLTNEQGAFKQILVGYTEAATNEFDLAYDGISFNGNTALDFYSINEDKNLTIQANGLPFNDNDVFKLGFSTAAASTFVLKVDHADGFLQDKIIFVEDKVSQTLVPLATEGYKFTSEKGLFNDRFLLRFTDKNLSNSEFEKEKEELTVVKNSQVITVGLRNQILDELWLYSVDGKEIYHKKDIQKAHYSIQPLPISQQVAILKVKGWDGKVFSTKVILP